MIILENFIAFFAILETVWFFFGKLSTYAVLELKQHYDVQVKELVGSHQRELTQLRDDHKVEISRMQKALEVVG